MVYDKARELARDISQSPEYTEYKKLREAAMANETTKGLIQQYHQLQLRAQAAQLGGQKDEELMTQLQKLGEILDVYKRQGWPGDPRRPGKPGSPVPRRTH